MDETPYLIPPIAPTDLPIEFLISDEDLDFCSSNSGEPAKE